MNFSKHYYVVFTVTVASPAVFTSTNHELYIDDQIQLATTGALPTGLSVDTTYYVIRSGITTTTFKLSASKGGTAITTTGTQSGTHSYIKVNKANLTPLEEDNR
jgi:hypothetical protein